MRLTASSKDRKEACAYEKVCAYKKGVLNNLSLQYMHLEICLPCTISTHINHKFSCCKMCLLQKNVSANKRHLKVAPPLVIHLPLPFILTVIHVAETMIHTLTFAKNNHLFLAKAHK